MNSFTFISPKKRSKIEMVKAFNIVYPECDLIKCSCIANQARTKHYKIHFELTPRLDTALISLRLNDLKHRLCK